MTPGATLGRAPAGSKGVRLPVAAQRYAAIPEETRADGGEKGPSPSNMGLGDGPLYTGGLDPDLVAGGNGRMGTVLHRLAMCEHEPRVGPPPGAVVWAWWQLQVSRTGP